MIHKITKSFVASLVVLLSSASLTNLPTQVSASESSSSSVLSSEVIQSATSKESTPSTSESSKSESSQSVMLSGLSTSSKLSIAKVQAQSAVKSVSTQVVDDTEPAPPTIAENGVGVASPDGKFFGINRYQTIPLGFPSVQGFLVQPQAEQYLLADSKGLNPISLSYVASTFIPEVGAELNNTLRLWTWVPPTTADPKGHWAGPTVPTKTQNVKSSFTSTGKPKIVYSIYNLPVGKYYAQVTTDFNALTSGTNQKVSKLFKFNIVEKPTDATAITADVPKVLFAGVDYNVSAVTDPVNATGKISWGTTTATTTIGATWNQQNGRKTSFIIDNDKQDPAINTNPTNPGIPVNIGNNSYNDAIAVGGNGKAVSSKPGQEYVGGLVAKKMAAEDGGTWSLDSAGLDDLEKAANPNNDSNVTWDYQWAYSIDGGKSFANFTASDAGVSNFKGQVKKASDLDNVENQLTFSKDSDFATKAAAATTKGTDYVVREALIATAPNVDTSQNPVKLNINSNKASLTVTKVTGKLSLDAVPDFNFGTITASKLYNGTLDPNTAPNAGAGGTLTITDTRVPATGVTNDWTLKATASKFTSGTGSAVKTLNPVTMRLSNILGIPGSKDLTETENTIAVKNGSSLSGGTNPSSLVKASLLMTPNPKIQLTDGDAFSSQITWNLTTTQLIVPKAK